MSDLGQSIAQAVNTINQGGILIYPTEGVFGMGCNFKSKTSVLKLLELKQRPMNKGLILIASHIEQILPLIAPSDPLHLARALKTWPGHNTWVFPKTKKVPEWISGDFNTVAVRVSKHPTVQKLCQQLNSAIVSTSANLSGESTMNSCQQLQNIWGSNVDYYLDLPLGDKNQASCIRSAKNGTVLR